MSIDQYKCTLELNTYSHGNGLAHILHLPDSLALNCQSFHLREVVVKCNNVCDYGLLIWVLSEHICKQYNIMLSISIMGG